MLVLAALLSAAGVLAVGALGRQGDSPMIVVDQSIGGVSIGMTQAEVEALLGAPVSTLDITLRGGGTGLLARYAEHGGLLLVEYADGRVISVETNSPFYRTSGHIGPGTSKAGLHGFHPDFCSLGLWDGSSAIPVDGVVTVFELDGDQIADVTITELGYYNLCESVPADQEVSDPRSPTVELTVVIDPDGAGYVRSAPYRIDCPTQCEKPFARGDSVALAANPTPGFTFQGWGGACTGQGGCVLTLDEDSTVIAYFDGKYQPPPTTPPKPKGPTGETGQTGPTGPQGPVG